ncbi:KNOX2 protein [Vigna unguiculata]|uniref:KNOX2 protein n=1 Tax=Vigna unguiculata TaxID=3917 RepID=A0A4D6LUP4_VIGUN|nr:KNOX2 protein [Vigna unguiculata]
MESHRPNTTIHTYKQLQQQDHDDEEEVEEQNNEILKTRISNHPLYGVLLQAHLDCLKVGEISKLEREVKIDEMKAREKQKLDMLSQSELDLFMEAYCLALGKLKEAMVEPQQKSMAFINNMHSQLREITNPSSEPAPPSASSSHCNFTTN